MTKNRFALVFAAAAATLILGLLATAGLSSPASAAPAGDTSDSTLSPSRTAGMPGAAKDPIADDWPEHEQAGEIYVRGVWGMTMWDDYDANIQNHFDRDNFYVVDYNDDGNHVSLSVTHNGKTYTEHDAGGKAAFIDVGNIKDGETVQLKGCVWTHDHRLVGCAESELTE